MENVEICMIIIRCLRKDANFISQGGNIFSFFSVQSNICIGSFSLLEDYFKYVYLKQTTHGPNIVTQVLFGVLHSSHPIFIATSKSQI